MSVLFEIKSSTGSYQVEIAAGLYRKIIAAKDECLIICDERFASAFQTAGHKYIAVGASENNKSLAAIPDIIIAMRRMGVTRGTRLIAVGGGIVQDVAAFCAAIYMRGLDWHYVPTTLLGMSDSCIGGKSSINVGEFKNIVGTFNPPSRVIVDPLLTETLSDEQKAAGLIEAAKICYCRGPQSWDIYAALDPSLTMPLETATEVISTSLAAKKWFIETDEFDKKERLLLNFGHTFGHAFEGASHFGISHGIAVGVGMLCAGNLSRSLGIKIDDETRLRALEEHITALLQAVKSLPTQLAAITTDQFFDRFKSDKKHSRECYNVVMPSGQGVELRALPKNAENEDGIKLAVREIKQRLVG